MIHHNLSDMACATFLLRLKRHLYLGRHVCVNQIPCIVSFDIGTSTDNQQSGECIFLHILHMQIVIAYFAFQRFCICLAFNLHILHFSVA